MLGRRGHTGGEIALAFLHSVLLFFVFLPISVLALAALTIGDAPGVPAGDVRGFALALAVALGPLGALGMVGIYRWWVHGRPMALRVFDLILALLALAASYWVVSLMAAVGFVGLFGTQPRRRPIIDDDLDGDDDLGEGDEPPD
jgi:hypothetical protein